MSYLVLARKYRPQSFDQVVEQSHVTKTLTNAILSNRVAHAILLSGPRGTGKTTIARIIAKSMNCANGPTPSPCNVCRSCTEITTGHSVDVFEIDGASNNSVDQIRELRENIRYMPAHSAYKIYIIDEVHMLSTAAFNALLKTLEEPPPHVMFIFATTEVHKIPVTILSRCQRHELRRLPLASLQNHLVDLCAREKISIPAPVLDTITRESGGSMRDALSLLDQLLGSMPEDADTEDLLSIIGVAGRDIIHSTCEAIIKGDISTMLEKVEEIYLRGLDITRFYHDVISYMRDLVLAASGCGTRALQINEKEMGRIRSLSGETGVIHLSQLVEALINSEQTLKFASTPRIAVEMIFMRLIHMKQALSVNELISKIEGLKGQISSGRQVASPDTRNYGQQGSMPEVAPPRSMQQISESRQPAYKPSYQINNQVNSQALNQTTHQAAHQPVMPAVDPRPTEEEAPRPEPPKSQQRFQDGPLSGRQLTDFWQAVLQVIDKKSKPLFTLVSGSKIKEFNGSDLTFEITGTKFATDRVQTDKSKAIIREAAEEVLGKPIKAINVNTVAEDPAVTEEARKTGDLKNKAMNNPVVTRAVEIFGGRIKDIKILGE